MGELATFWAVFLDLEDERPGAYFCTKEDAEAYLSGAAEPQHGDVVPFKIRWDSWNDLYTRGRLNYRKDYIEKIKKTGTYGRLDTKKKL